MYTNITAIVNTIIIAKKRVDINIAIITNMIANDARTDTN